MIIWTKGQGWKKIQGSYENGMFLCSAPCAGTLYLFTGSLKFLEMAPYLTLEGAAKKG